MQKAIGVLLGIIMKFFAIVAGYVYPLVAKLFDFFMTGVRTNVATWGITEIGWVAVRDVFNMFFILILLVIAFATVLGIQDWQYKRLLPRLIISVILVNFSRTICAFFIEFSDLLMYSFTFGNSSGLTAQLNKLLNVGDVTKFSSTIEVTKINDLSVAAGYAVSVAVVWGFIFMMVLIVFTLLKRAIVLLFLTVVSPAVFVLDILPATRQYASEWWKRFMKYVFYGPIVTFGVRLTLAALQWAVQPGNQQLSGVLSGGELDGAGGSVVQSRDFATTKVANSDMTLENLLGYIFVAGLFVGTAYMASIGGGALGKAAAGGIVGGAKKGAGFAGRLAGGAARVTSRSLARGSRGVAGRMLGSVAGVGGFAVGGVGGLLSGRGLSGAYDQARQAGARTTNRAADALRYASPSTLVDSFNRKRENLRQAGEEADRKVFLNSAYNRDQSKYGSEVNAGVRQSMSQMQAQDPSLSSGGLVSNIKSSFDTGDQVDREAAMMHLMNKGSFTDLLSAAQSDDSLRNDLFSKEFLKNNPGDLVDSPELRKDMFEKSFGNRAQQFSAQSAAMLEQQGRFDMSHMANLGGDSAAWNNQRIANEKALASFDNLSAQQQAAAPIESDYAMSVGADGSVTPGRPSDLRELAALSGQNNPQDNPHAWRSLNGAKRKAIQNPGAQQQSIDLAAKSLVMNYALNGTSINGKSFSSQKGVNGSSKELSAVAGARGINTNDPTAMNAFRSELQSAAQKLVTSNKDDLRKFAEKHLGDEYADPSGKAWKDLESQIDRSVKDAAGGLSSAFGSQINRSMSQVKTDFEK